jgi:type II secretory pathway predicted ATPase ExeA
MYWQFYDLAQAPLHLTPDPACFFPHPHHEDALATLKAAQRVPETLNVLCMNALIAGFWAQQRPVSTRAAWEAIAQVQSSRSPRLRCW